MIISHSSNVNTAKQPINKELPSFASRQSKFDKTYEEVDHYLRLYQMRDTVSSFCQLLRKTPKELKLLFEDKKNADKAVQVADTLFSNAQTISQYLEKTFEMDKTTLPQKDSTLKNAALNMSVAVEETINRKKYLSLMNKISRKNSLEGFEGKALQLLQDQKKLLDKTLHLSQTGPFSSYSDKYIQASQILSSAEAITTLTGIINKEKASTVMDIMKPALIEIHTAVGQRRFE